MTLKNYFKFQYINEHMVKKLSLRQRGKPKQEIDCPVRLGDRTQTEVVGAQPVKSRLGLATCSSVSKKPAPLVRL
jgi:hypothetical protein